MAPVKAVLHSKGEKLAYKVPANNESSNDHSDGLSDVSESPPLTEANVEQARSISKAVIEEGDCKTSDSKAYEGTVSSDSDVDVEGLSPLVAYPSREIPNESDQLAPEDQPAGSNVLASSMDFEPAAFNGLVDSIKLAQSQREVIDLLLNSRHQQQHQQQHYAAAAAAAAAAVEFADVMAKTSAAAAAVAAASGVSSSSGGSSTSFMYTPSLSLLPQPTGQHHSQQQQQQPPPPPSLQPTFTTDRQRPFEHSLRRYQPIQRDSIRALTSLDATTRFSGNGVTSVLLAGSGGASGTDNGVTDSRDSSAGLESQPINNRNHLQQLHHQDVRNGAGLRERKPSPNYIVVQPANLHYSQHQAQPPQASTSPAAAGNNKPSLLTSVTAQSLWQPKQSNSSPSPAKVAIAAAPSVSSESLLAYRRSRTPVKREAITVSTVRVITSKEASKIVTVGPTDPQAPVRQKIVQRKPVDRSS